MRSRVCGTRKCCSDLAWWSQTADKRVVAAANCGVPVAMALLRFSGFSRALEKLADDVAGLRSWHLEMQKNDIWQFWLPNLGQFPHFVVENAFQG